MRKNNILFIIMFLIIILFLQISLFRKPKEFSILENRELNQFKHFTMRDFVKGEYQSNIEASLSDQLLGSETIKRNMNNYLYFSDGLINKGMLCKKHYLLIGKVEEQSFYNFDCDRRIVYGATVNVEEHKKSMIETLDSYYDVAQKYDTYFYYIPTPSTFNFVDNKETISLLEIIKNSKKYNYNIDYLKYKDYDEFRKLFYATDHHWNHKGSYQGYKDIHNLLGLKDDIIKPIKEVTFPFNYFGSSARLLQNDKYKEKFKVYKYNLPNHKSIITESNKKYGKEEEYYKGIYEKDKYTNHYGEFYGWDYKEVVFDYGQKDKENLLLISDSFSNAVNELIAYHFNKTYVVDLRFYKDLNVDQYVRKNNISKILFIMDSGTYFKDSKFILKKGGF